MFYLEIYGQIYISNVLIKKKIYIYIYKTKQAEAQSQSALLAVDETGASSYLSELLSDLGFHEIESSVQL